MRSGGLREEAKGNGRGDNGRMGVGDQR